MDLIIFILVFLILTAFLLAGNYYRRLFSDGRDEYQRKELLRAEVFLWSEVQRLFNNDAMMSYAGVGIGVVLGLLFSLMGGIYGAYYESYLFNSALIPVLWFLGSTYIKDAMMTELPEFLQRFITHDTAFFVAISMTTAAQALVVYGLYHAISFIWVLLNLVIIFSVVLYRLFKVERAGGGLPVPAEVDDDDY